MAALKQVYGSLPHHVFEVSSTTTTIGRHEDCDILIDSPAVSRYHSHILCEKGRYFIEDLNSRNGTNLNGLPVSRKMLLSDGDVVEFSTLAYRFLSQDSLSEASGSWGTKANVITITPQVDIGDDSVRRQIVAQGDRITDAALGSDSLRVSQVVARVAVADPGAGWPVISGATQKLSFVLRMMHSLRRTVAREEVIGRSLQALFAMFSAAERIAIVMKTSHGDGLRIEAAVSRDEQQEVEICLPVIRTSMQNLEGLLYVDHWNSSSGKNPELDNPSLRSILAVPMVGLVGECLGVIQVDSTSQTLPLRTEDLELLVILSNLMAYAIEQSFEIESAISQAVNKRSTAHARRLRTGLTPVEPPSVPGYRLANSLLATPDVAADLIDYVQLSDGRVACFLIDVPGRGPDAANLMAVIARLLSEFIPETGSAAKSIQRTEMTLASRMQDIPMVISVAVLILNPRRSSVSVSVAGHCPIFMVQKNEVKAVDLPDIFGPPLGAKRESYLEAELPLPSNDLLLLMSDGLTKLRSSPHQSFRHDDVLTLLSRCLDGPHSDFESRLEKYLLEFLGDMPLADDVAFALVHRTNNADTVDFSSMRMDVETTNA